MVALVVVGCTGTAQVALRQPVNTRCEDAGLVSCEDWTRGAVLYADGREAAGRAVLGRALARNADRAVALGRFASSLEALRDSPVTEEYVDSLEPAITLIQDAASAAGRAGVSSMRNLEGGATEAFSLASSGQEVRSSPAERFSGFLQPVGTARGRPCDGNGPAGATCVLQGMGVDAVVTDLVLSPACPYDVFVFSGSLLDPR